MRANLLSILRMIMLIFVLSCQLSAHAQVATAHRTGEMLFGVQAWTFSHFTVMDAIERVAQAGGSNIELYPGQDLGKDFPGIKVGPGMDQTATDALRAQLAKFGVNVVAYGVTGIDKDEAGARKLFAWAKSLGIGILNTESTDAIDTMDKMVKEFDIRVGFHNHPRTNDPNYKVWNPNYILQLVKNHDPRIGACADVGHWVRSGVKPVDALRILKGRVMSCHLKDLHEFSPNGHDVPFGTGVSGMSGILEELHRQGFRGSASIEYEYDWETSIPEVAQCIGFVRGYFASH
ncbi:MAG: sugar phosphate isomerase/epimerase family protein [Fimbriimonadales bacterium]